MKFLKDLIAVLPNLDTANTERFCKTLEKYRPHLSEISEIYMRSCHLKIGKDLLFGF